MDGPCTASMQNPVVAVPWDQIRSQIDDARAGHEPFPAAFVLRGWRWFCQSLLNPTWIPTAIQDCVDVDRVRLDQVVEGEWEAFDQHPMKPIYLQMDTGVCGKQPNVSLAGIQEAIAKT